MSLEDIEMLKNINIFKTKLRNGHICVGTSISLNDPAVTEALAAICDFVWIDMEHSSLSLEAVRNHIMATRGTEAAALVRVPWNDPVLIKPVLDLGASGIMVPMVRCADEAAVAVAACQYPPDGIRGFGPLRASNYGRVKASTFCEESNRTVMTLIQIEHIEAVANLDSIFDVPGINDIVIGPSDLAASMGHIGDVDHPEVIQTIEVIIRKACAAGVNVGLATGSPAPEIATWARKGVRWFSLLNDVLLLMQAVDDRLDAIRRAISD